MMRALVVGGDGFIGAALVAALVAAGHDVIPTTRRPGAFGLQFDLAGPLPAPPDDRDVVFIVAAVNGFAPCEGSAMAWRVNADAPVEIARRSDGKAFVVFVSSDCVEWCGMTAYARQKAYAEIAIRMIGGAVVRPARVTPQRVHDLCALLIDVGEHRKAGVHRWQ